ncbi:Alkyl hydroperoxide reductase AhpD [Rosistilla oblonga]|uniref:Alkyl hydroperoxide reductase AhpD n=1 Tax=Rosistilla oblonga TaxID=2527990 RepID=A0A518ITG0_9BACT|nr:carboxymuconolactone decarboxylase family protein [Rosistilla oblonga]QDV12321.1 Alkyl hydroperoxide reductase AhpD [Rosistilla oblonga]QDV56363.1 Alkyl hydroperoxide reductase AhpD [Rosistilla oblonga]
MPRLKTIGPNEAQPPLKEIYDDLTSQMGKVVNIFQGMGNSPAALKAYLSMSAALAEGDLSPEDREIIYLAVSEQNGCHYCVSAHAMLAKRVGLADDAIRAARQFQSSDPKHESLLTFVRRVIASKGFVSDEELQAVKSAGYSDGQIAEAVGYIGLATFSNLFNHVNGTELDFPAAEKI